MQRIEESRASGPQWQAPSAFCDFALRIAGPTDGQLEVSIDGAAYRPCRYADGFWWHHWAGTLRGSHHMAVVIRSTASGA